MSLKRYHNSRSSDNVFKLLHKENTYLDMLKENVGSGKRVVEKAGSPHEIARKQLLQEQDPGVKAIEDSKIDEKPEDEESSDVENEVKEGALNRLIEDELEEISISVARQAGKRAAQKKALAARGILGSKAAPSRVPKKRPAGLM